MFCFDGDRAGLKAAWRALENALPLARDGRELKFMFLPEGHDPDTLVAAEGARGFEERLRSALPLSEYLVRQLLLDVDLTHVDGRAKLAALAAPLFARMPEGVYRELLARSARRERSGCRRRSSRSTWLPPGAAPASARSVRPRLRNQPGRRAVG